ncbi:hypothetical protein EVAR_98379_1 [Eumeta japonica]|uniref:Uncharacterized protein n=1 Tax=Eumeta variegata TaxID=151549 RepID=A0A4C1XP08_EUMVA|nr:hypothetical protein EVAR_98379_1 [Eumeta japonica]
MCRTDFNRYILRLVPAGELRVTRDANRDANPDPRARLRNLARNRSDVARTDVGTGICSAALGSFRCSLDSSRGLRVLLLGCDCTWATVIASPVARVFVFPLNFDPTARPKGGPRRRRNAGRRPATKGLACSTEHAAIEPNSSHLKTRPIDPSAPIGRSVASSTLRLSLSFVTLREKDSRIKRLLPTTPSGPQDRPGCLRVGRRRH